MRGSLLLCAIPALMFSQVDAPPGIVQGRLVEVPAAATGRIQLRVSTQQILQCVYDNSTYFERQGRSVAAAGLKADDDLEMVTDRKDGACYVRTVYVLDPPNPGQRVRTRPLRPVVETWLPRGNLTLSGVVIRLNPELLILRVRTGEQKTLVIRQDTRFIDGGVPTGPEQLRPNTRISVRAGTNLDQELEAYQIVWGRIEGP